MVIKKGFKLLADVIEDVKFIDGISIKTIPAGWSRTPPTWPANPPGIAKGVKEKANINQIDENLNERNQF